MVNILNCIKTGNITFWITTGIVTIPSMLIELSILKYNKKKEKESKEKEEKEAVLK